MSNTADRVRESYADSISYIVPYDAQEEAIQTEIIDWINSQEPLTKLENPRQHLGAVAFITTIEGNKVFLINHRKAGTDLMPGGHVDLGRTLQETIQDELAEELGIEVDMSNTMPFFIAKVLTRGSNSGHYDVTAVFKVVVDEETDFKILEKEADKARWFDRSELRDLPAFTLLPDVDRKLSIDKHVLLDNGGVLSNHYCAPYHKELADMLGIDEETLKELLSESSVHGRDYRLDRMTREQFWEEVTTLAGVRSDIDIARLEELWALSYQLNLDVVGVLKRYRNVGVKIGLISNSDIYRKKYMSDTQGQKEFLDYSVISCDVGELKPGNAIFTRAVECADTSPSNILYFDDRRAHTLAAANAGMVAEVYTSTDELEKTISTFYRKGRA